MAALMPAPAGAGDDGHARPGHEDQGRDSGQVWLVGEPAWRACRQCMKAMHASQQVHYRIRPLSDSHVDAPHNTSIQAWGCTVPTQQSNRITWLCLLGKSPFRTATISSRHSALVVSYTAGAGGSMPLHPSLPKLREATKSSSACQAGNYHKDKHICSSTDAWRSKSR